MAEETKKMIAEMAEAVADSKEAAAFLAGFSAGLKIQAEPETEKEE